MVPVIAYMRHVREIGEGCADVRKTFAEKEKAVVMYISIRRVCNVNAAKMEMEVVTKTVFEFIPKVL